MGTTGIRAARKIGGGREELEEVRGQQRRTLMRNWSGHCCFVWPLAHSRHAHTVHTFQR